MKSDSDAYRPHLSLQKLAMYEYRLMYNPGLNVFTDMCMICAFLIIRLPLDSVGSYRSKTFENIQSVWASGGWEKRIYKQKAVCTTVNCRLLAVPYQKEEGKGKCPKPFWSGL